MTIIQQTPPVIDTFNLTVIAVPVGANLAQLVFSQEYEAVMFDSVGASIHRCGMAQI